MEIDRLKAKEWYENNGVSDTDWENLGDYVQQAIGLEALVDSWSAVESMREGGLPGEVTVLIYYSVESLGLDPEMVIELDERETEQLTSYVLQNTTESTIEELFNSSAVEVFEVTKQDIDGELFVVVNCEVQDILV